MGEFRLKLLGWDRERRFVVVREQLRETKRSLGRKLLEVPGYTFRVFVTNRAEAPEEIWRDYNQRACIEQRIEELKSDLAADDFCLREFFATEAAFLGICGVVEPPNTTYGQSTGANNFNSNGSRDETSDLTIDGVTGREKWRRRVSGSSVAYTPSCG